MVSSCSKSTILLGTVAAVSSFERVLDNSFPSSLEQLDKTQSTEIHGSSGLSDGMPDVSDSCSCLFVEAS